jgi:hypothetical protein
MDRDSNLSSERLERERRGFRGPQDEFVYGMLKSRVLHLLNR